MSRHIFFRVQAALCLLILLWGGLRLQQALFAWDLLWAQLGAGALYLAVSGAGLALAAGITLAFLARGGRRATRLAAGLDLLAACVLWLEKLAFSREYPLLWQTAAASLLLALFAAGSFGLRDEHEQF